jgi:molybdopterin-guanine dinucleotide biosynthesis protein A
LYRSTCTPEVERRLHSDDRSLRGLAKAVGAAFIGEDAVARVADAQTTFLNVNTVRERDRAEDLLDPRAPATR